MARQAAFRRGSGSGNEEATVVAGPMLREAPNGNGAHAEDARRPLSRRFMNWLGYGLETDEAADQAEEPEAPAPEVAAANGAAGNEVQAEEQRPGESDEDWLPPIEPAATKDAPEQPIERKAEPPQPEVDDQTAVGVDEPAASEPIAAEPASDAPVAVNGEPVAAGGDIERRIEAAAASAALAAEERAIAEILALEEDLERADEEASSRIAELEGRLAEAEGRLAAERERFEREAAGREQAAEAERQRIEAELRDEIASLTAELESEREARAEALADAERRIEAAEERAAKNFDSELAREKTALEAELAATHRQLAAAHERLVAAGRRAAEIETSSRREREHEQRRRSRLLGSEREPAPHLEPAFVSPRAPDSWLPEAHSGAERLSLAAASFQDLRDLGMSVTQAKRVLRYRDERGISDPAELDQVPGFPKGFLTAVKERLTP
jgi:hypothetical protein